MVHHTNTEYLQVHFLLHTILYNLNVDTLSNIHISYVRTRHILSAKYVFILQLVSLLLFEKGYAVMDWYRPSRR